MELDVSGQDPRNNLTYIRAKRTAMNHSDRSAIDLFFSMEGEEIELIMNSWFALSPI